MNVVKFTILAILCLSIFTACEKSVDDPLLNKDSVTTQEIGDQLSAEARGRRAIPFKAKFYTLRNYENNGAGFCTEAPFLDFNYQVGEGTGTHLGRFTTIISFCSDLATFTYKNGEGVFVAANGDELYFQAPSEGEVGHILPINHPLYEFQFQDPFIFDGGTGRFEGATGGGMTNSFVDLFDDEGNFIPEHRTDHTWTGTLVLD